MLQLVVSVRMRGGPGNARDKEGGWLGGHRDERGRKSTGARKNIVCEAAALLPKMVWKHWGLATAEELSRHAS